MQKTWITKNKLTAKNSRRQAIIDILLANRNLITQDQKDKFFSSCNPDAVDLSQIGVVKTQISKALKRLDQAYKKQEKVVIYGDYDADGITATAILWETLNRLGFDVMPFLPHREQQGYGLKSKGIDAVIAQYGKPGLLLTVDNGIVAFEGADYCRSLGIDLIISDHHEPLPTSHKYPENKKGRDMPRHVSTTLQIPNCIACIYSTDTAGAAVSFLLAKAILEKFNQATPAILNSLIELATIGIIADLVPLLGVSRAIAKCGLKLLPQTKRPGLKALFIEADIDKLEEFSSYHVGFIIGPRLNATGRLEHPIDSLRLLCTTNKDRGIKLAIDLASINKDRQELTAESVDKVLRCVKKSGEENKIIITSSPDYNPGVIGLIAGKITEKFYRPAIAIAIMGDVAKGSVRSVTGVNIIDFLRHFEKDFLELGGHAMAAGFSVETANLAKLTQKLEKYAQKTISDELLVPTVETEVEINLSDLSMALYQDIQQFAPFGIGNPQPIFLTQNLTAKSFNTVGKAKNHLKLWLADSKGNNLNGIYFNGGAWESKLAKNPNCQAAYQIDLNEWNGKKSLQLMVKEIGRE